VKGNIGAVPLTQLKNYIVVINWTVSEHSVYAGVVDFLSTEISTSKQKKFSLVTFVDTPGLVDGDMQYPFNVNEAILWLGKPDSCML